MQTVGEMCGIESDYFVVNWLFTGNNSTPDLNLGQNNIGHTNEKLVLIWLKLEKINNITWGKIPISFIQNSYVEFLLYLGLCDYKCDIAHAIIHQKYTIKVLLKYWFVPSTRNRKWWLTWHSQFFKYFFLLRNFKISGWVLAYIEINDEQ